MFLKGVVKSTEGKNPKTWFRLFAKKENNTGYWYYKGTTNSHAKLTIHSTSKNKLNKKIEKGYLVVDDDCWLKLIKVINATEKFTIIKAETFSKGSLTNTYHKVRTLGNLNVIN